jgi:hypothetical protein
MRTGLNQVAQLSIHGTSDMDDEYFDASNLAIS